MSTNRKFTRPEALNIHELAVDEVYCLWGRCHKKGSKNGKVWQFKEYKTKNLVKHFPKCYYFIHNLISRNDREHNGDRSVFTNLSQEILKEGIPESTYDVVVSLLYALNIVECDNEYVPPFIPLRKKDPLTGKVQDAKCYGYRLTEAYRGKTATTEADNKILVRKQRNAKRKGDKVILSHPAFLYQREQFLKPTFSIESLDDIKLLLGTTDYKGDLITSDHINEMIEDLEILSKGSVEEFRPDNWGRLHTTVVQMKREARPFINGIDGKPLVQFDFKSSYTFHLIKLISDKKGIYVFTNYTGGVPQYVPTFSLANEIQSLYSKCMDEGLYEYIAREYESAYGPLNRDWETSVRLAKESWNRTFLNKGSCKTLLAQLIRSLFPKINSFIEEWGRYRIWETLMRSEAELIHHKIIARIGKELGFNCTLFSIHDALLTDQLNSPVVGYIMEEEAEIYFKFPTRIKSEQMVRPKIYQSVTYSLESATATK